MGVYNQSQVVQASIQVAVRLRQQLVVKEKLLNASKRDLALTSEALNASQKEVDKLHSEIAARRMGDFLFAGISLSTTIIFASVVVWALRRSKQLRRPVNQHLEIIARLNDD